MYISDIHSDIAQRKRKKKKKNYNKQLFIFIKNNYSVSFKIVLNLNIVSFPTTLATFEIVIFSANLVDFKLFLIENILISTFQFCREDMGWRNGIEPVPPSFDNRFGVHTQKLFLTI